MQQLTSRNMSCVKPTKLGLRHRGRSARQISWPSPLLSILKKTLGQPYASRSESSVITYSQAGPVFRVLGAMIPAKLSVRLRPLGSDELSKHGLYVHPVSVLAQPKRSSLDPLKSPHRLLFITAAN
jgi:hypothetical protein